MTTVRRRLQKPCLDCGALSPNTRCPRHTAIHEATRIVRQPYRAAYFTPFYREQRLIALLRAGWRCERVTDDERCPRAASETNHIVPLSTARSYDAAIALCIATNLEAVCFDHNPRGG